MRLYQLSHHGGMAGSGMVGRSTFMPMTREPKKQTSVQQQPFGSVQRGGALGQTTNLINKPVPQNQPNPNIEDLQQKLSQLSMAGRKTGKNGKRYISL